MASERDFKRILDNHEKRIVRLESLLAKPSKVVAPKGKHKLTYYIIQLREKGFFTRPKTAEETHVKLQDSYQCEPNRVAIALLRLSRRRQLRRVAKVVEKKEYKAYAW